MRDRDGLTPDDERAIAEAAARRRLEEQREAAERAEAAELDARRAELPRAMREDARERWRWFKALAKRVMRSVTR